MSGMTPDHLFGQTAIIKPYLGYDLGGEKLGETYELPCRVEMSRKRVSRLSAAGGAVQEVIANARAFFSAGTRFEPNTKVIIDGRTFQALSVTPVRGVGVESHVEVMLL